MDSVSANLPTLFCQYTIAYLKGPYLQMKGLQFLCLLTSESVCPETTNNLVIFVMCTQDHISML